MKLRLACCLALSAVPAIPGAWSADVARFENADTGLKGWRLLGEGIEVELIQRLPIQTRAFFEARGLSLVAAREIGETCVMQTIVRNVLEAETGIALKIELATWSVLGDGDPRPVLTKDAFLDRWSDQAASEAARVAFRWATFPSTQVFLPGDYNWGMTMLGAKPGTVVDLQVAWHIGDERREAWIRGVECAADRQ